MATTFDEERFLQQIQHLNESRRVFDFLFNNNDTPDVSSNNKLCPGTDLMHFPFDINTSKEHFV